MSATMPTERSSHDGFDREELMKYMITDCIDAGGDSEAEDMADLVCGSVWWVAQCFYR